MHYNNREKVNVHSEFMMEEERRREVH